jgi:hypothetical protein
MSIENTQDPASRELTSLLLLATGDTDTVIGAQEKAGQRQVVHSDSLPTEIHGSTDADFEALGFTFGPVDPHDPLFRPATLPDGWTKEGSDHDMWSHVVDGLGRRRVGIFYKAAFYDRCADMHLINLLGYVAGCVREGKPIVTDGVWATRENVAAELRNAAGQAGESVANWERIAGERGPDETSAKYVAQYTAERDEYAELADEYTT